MHYRDCYLLNRCVRPHQLFVTYVQTPVPTPEKHKQWKAQHESDVSEPEPQSSDDSAPDPQGVIDLSQDLGMFVGKEEPFSDTDTIAFAMPPDPDSESEPDGFHIHDAGDHQQQDDEKVSPPPSPPPSSAGPTRSCSTPTDSTTTRITTTSFTTYRKPCVE